MLKQNDIVKNKCSKSISYIFVLYIALLPILAPYAVGGGSIMVSIPYLLTFGMLVYFAFFRKKVRINRALVCYLLFTLFLTVFAVIHTDMAKMNLGIATKVFIVYLIFLIVFSSMWLEIDAKLFFRVVEAIGFICALLAIIQFIAVNLGFENFYDGRLPFQLERYSSFGGIIEKTTGSVRVHSFFEEPSYLALYELPIVAYCLQNQRYVKGAIIALSCIISGTALGFLGLMIVLSVVFLTSEIPTKLKLRFVVVISVAIIIFIIAFSVNDSLNEMVKYYQRRYANISSDFQRSDSSVSQRILGNIALFKTYPLINMIFGVGINQYQFYFDLSVDYSNDIVSTLLNYGVVGIVALFVWLCGLLKRIKPNGIVYLAFLCIVLAVDHTWFTEFFFYLLTWVVLNSKSTEMVRLKI